jgi:ABC-type hemin transport system ATPase subunit
VNWKFFFHPGKCYGKKSEQNKKEAVRFMSIIHKGGTKMATRRSMSDFFQQCEDVMKFAEEQYKKASTQEHYNENEYTDALRKLEETYNDLAKLALSANEQQREQLHRMRLELQQMQNSMILLDH